MPGLEGLVGDQVRQGRLVSWGNFVWLKVAFDLCHFRGETWGERFLAKAV